MVRLKTVAALLFISLFVVLPLYELADVGEHWPHDGAYVSMVSSVLFFIGFTLVLRKSVSLAAKNSVASQAAHSGYLERARTPAPTAADSHGARAAHARVRARLKLSDALAAIVDDTNCPRSVILRDFRV